MLTLPAKLKSPIKLANAKDWHQRIKRLPTQTKQVNAQTRWIKIN